MLFNGLCLLALVSRSRDIDLEGLGWYVQAKRANALCDPCYNVIRGFLTNEHITGGTPQHTTEIHF